MCLELDAGRTCGAFGFCDKELNKCICDDGWSQSFEMIFFPFTKEKVTANRTELFDRLPCNLNKSLLFSFFLLSFISSSIALLYNLPFLTTKKRFLRQLPLLLSFFFLAMLNLIRVIDLDRIFQEDKLFTFTLAIAMVFHNLGNLVFVSKYISYHLNKLKKAFGADLKIFGFKMTPVLKGTTPIFFALDLTLLPLFIISSFVDKETAGYLFYIENWIQCFRSIIRDMQVILDSHQDETKKASNFYLYCKSAIPNLRMVVYAVIGYSFVFGQAFFFYPIFKFQELIHIYYWAISGFGWSLMSTIITYSLIKNLKKGKSLRTNTQTKPKFKTPSTGPGSGLLVSTSI
eukprot:snap_masked-scaffold_44-processed-gene-0.33-mRNA-1 protein AED:1.00 eAED:1.00 QI:0/0/0/0/1/1/2/0/344